MKIHILYPFVDGPWGGANQFLKAIKEYFVSIGNYAENPLESDLILFNASPNALVSLLPILYKLKKKKPKLLIVNRIDGPVFFIRGKDLQVDRALYLFNRSVCDGTIYQSSWSMEKNFELGMERNHFEIKILNAPNNIIFNKNNKKIRVKDEKTKIIMTSWSSNIKKGFEVYKWLDKTLDFNKYSVTFVGNSPIEFENIEVKKPMDSKGLANELKSNDIFITASQNDPCSNSLIEALHCGLPCIGLNDGGHSEIISTGGEVFNQKEEILDLLKEIENNYSLYQNNISLPSIDIVGKKYHDFLNFIFSQEADKNYKNKRFTFHCYLKLSMILFFWRAKEKLLNLKNILIFLR
jgi:glycosyltransferase involved in cell wall biosynthesis